MRVAIVGAGPAGSMAAARLACAGATVSLFDHTHPREKPCGGGVTGRALALVADLIDVAALPAVVAESAWVEDPDEARPGARVALDDFGLSSRSSLVILSRTIFDLALLNAARSRGARLVSERVLSVSRSAGAMAVHTARGQYLADCVLGADGANSVVRKRLAAPFSRSQLSVAAGFFVHERRSSDIAIRSTTSQPGYLWSFPRPDHLAVGVCAPAASRTTSGQLRAESLAWIEQQGLGGSRLTPYAWPIPTVGSDSGRSSFAGPGWMLLGDAAGLVDPLTREGIYYALLSGRWASEALCEGSPGQAVIRYEGRLRDEIQPELGRAAGLSGMFFTRGFSSLLVEGLRESGPIRRVFADLVGGTQSYRGLRRRLLATRQWSLARRAIRVGLLPSFADKLKAAVLPSA